MSNQATSAPLSTGRSLSRGIPLGGAMVIAGTAIGAGMFSIPVVSAGMWFEWSLLAMALTWFVMYHSGLMILEANLRYPIGASFNTIVKDTLGSGWNTLNGLAVAFVLYTVTYAYVSGGGSALREIAAGQDIPIEPRWASLVFSLSLALIVWVSTKAVSRIATVMLGGMVITFLITTTSLLLEIDPPVLLDLGSENTRYAPYLLAALPFFLTSFGFHGNVPSLMKYYGKEPVLIQRALLIGSLLALSVYVLWQTSVLGNISREQFRQVIADGGNIGVLIGALGKSTESDYLSIGLSFFSNLAVASSFLGVSLGLFDYLADKFGFKDDTLGRLKTAGLTFAPPIICSMFYPDGFLHAIGYAGLAATIFGAIVPGLMVIAIRRRHNPSAYKVWGGNTLARFVIGFGGLVFLCHLLALADWLPVFP